MKKITIFFLASILFCSCDTLMTSYKFDTNPNHLSSVKLVDFINSGQDTTITLFRKALEHTGLDTFYNERNGLTVLIPNNMAFRALLKKVGVSKITEVDKNVLKQLILYGTVEGNYISSNMVLDSLYRLTSLSGDPLLVKRVVYSTDNYHLYFNPEQKDDPTFGCQQFPPYQQDLVFSDHSGHIVDYFPQYVLKCQEPDPAPEREDGGSIRWDLTADTHLYNGANATPKYNLENLLSWRTVNGQSRTTLLLFDRFTLPYDASMIFSAELNMYVKKNDTSGPLVTAFSVYDMTYMQGRRPVKEIAKGNFVPDFTCPMVGTIENVVTGSWNSGDFTELVRDFFSNPEKPDLFLGIRSHESQRHANGSVYVGWLNEDNPTDFSHNPSYITIVKFTLSELKVRSRDISCPANGIKALSKDDICAYTEGEPTFNYTDNNIFFELVSQPGKGVLTKNNLPLGNGVKFSQEELDKGIIKYYNSAPGEDHLIIHVTDYTKAVVEHDTDIKITID